MALKHMLRLVRTMLACTAAFALLAAWGPAASSQKRVSSEKKGQPELGDVPASVLRVENLKGRLEKVDLEKRTVTVAHSQGAIVFSFPTAAGREKISLSKKAARALGKRSLRLEDLQAGWKARVAYYPSLGTIQELLIEELTR